MLVADGMANSTELWNLIIYLSDGTEMEDTFTLHGIIMHGDVLYPTVSRELQVTKSEVVYEETGRYEVALTFYDPDSNCQAAGLLYMAYYLHPIWIQTS